MSDESPSYWRKCSTCKKPIAFGKDYWVCSVSTCNRKRAPLAFCKLSCWDAHLPIMNHREASASEKTAPTQAELANSEEKKAKKGREASASSGEILVVASKVKAYISSTADMSTSASVMDVLSDYLRQVADAAVVNAKNAGRQTVMARDISAPRQPKRPGVIVRKATQ